MPRFGRSVLLYNGAAGAATSEAVLPLAVPALARASKKLELIQTHSKEEFEEACKNSSGAADVLFVAGGDGTVHSAVQVLSSVEEPPILGIIPSGTCNDFARTLTISMALDTAAEELVSGEIKEIDSAQINEHSFLNFAGIGLIADASMNIDPDLKERYGKLSYFMSALQTMRQSESFSIFMEIDGVHYIEEGVAVLVMNGKSIGTHTFPLATIDPADGLLDIFIIQTSSLAAIREWFSLSQPDVSPEELDHITHHQGKHITIRTEQEMEVDTDGEIYLKTPVTIQIQPKRLQMLVPKTAEETAI
ncbi:diacylglycerol kinase family lipid kinase [Planococcus shenhongbingii]|uniref:Diacylglycerol kinase family lipid kinase n=1 Tax=Planococcus shenhongbingii TaxID=3058398 RepID=A0ABT8NAE5_9BACL|nr:MULTISPECIES: diacylglycerol kinase family protein [unclassified Planococcus (in: firmicutes)]MDN7244863.1 diacylglycerol kinase family lipid kinase [Planococcus sp. N017]WKA57980.1 diacylglycerol kinase family lipid kinase [Planococcus sp. N016]